MQFGSLHLAKNRSANCTNDFLLGAVREKIFVYKWNSSVIPYRVNAPVVTFYVLIQLQLRVKVVV